MSCDTDYQVFYSGKLALVFQTPEERTDDGLLKVPPKIFVLAYDPETDEVRGHRTPWKAAEELAPLDMGVLKNELATARASEPTPQLPRELLAPFEDPNS